MRNKFRGVRFTCIDELNIGCQGEPVMKGGHTHNHIFNVVNKNYFSKIYGRKIPKNHKTKYMATFMYFLNDIDSFVRSFSRAHIFGKGKKHNIKKSYLTLFR